MHSFTSTAELRGSFNCNRRKLITLTTWSEGLETSPKTSNIYREDITRWREDVNFMFEWQEQHCFCHGNIEFISSSQRLIIFFLLY